MFDPNMEDWTTYTERMKLHFIANDVTIKCRQETLHSALSVWASYVQGHLKILVKEGKPDTTTDTMIRRPISVVT